MEVITLDINTPICGTCHHWQGARHNEMGIRVRCLKEGDGLCMIRQQEKRSILEIIQPCSAGENCKNWLKLEVAKVFGNAG